MKKFFYFLCKVINWIIPFAIMSFFGNNSNILYKGYTFYAIIGYAVFAAGWYYWRDRKSRLTYQSFFFAGHIIGLINIFTESDTVFEAVLSVSSADVGTSAKILAAVITAVAFASKIVTMIFETEEYNAGAARRYNNSLDHDIYEATSELECATTAAERAKAEAHLERAKLNRERYKVDED